MQEFRPASVIEADTALVRDVADGDRDAVASLVARYGTPVTVLAAHLRDESTARSVAPEVFVEARREAGALAPGTELGPWLARITRDRVAPRSSHGSGTAAASATSSAPGSAPGPGDTVDAAPHVGATVDGVPGGGSSSERAPGERAPVGGDPVGGDPVGGDPVGADVHEGGIAAIWAVAGATSRVSPAARAALRRARIDDGQVDAGQIGEVDDAAVAAEELRLERRLAHLPSGGSDLLADPRSWIEADDDLADRVLAALDADADAGPDAGPDGRVDPTGSGAGGGALDGLGSDRLGPGGRGPASGAVGPSHRGAGGPVADGGDDGVDQDGGGAWWRTGRIAPAVIGVGAALAVLLVTIVALSAASGSPEPADLTVDLVSTGLIPDVDGGEIVVTDRGSGLEIELEAPTLPRRAGDTFYRGVIVLDDGTELGVGSFNEGVGVGLSAGVPLDRVRTFRVVEGGLGESDVGGVSTVLKVDLPRSASSPVTTAPG